MRRIPYGFFGMAFEWWMRLNPWIHYTVALLLIGGSTLAHFRGEIWPWGWSRAASSSC